MTDAPTLVATPDKIQSRFDKFALLDEGWNRMPQEEMESLRMDVLFPEISEELLSGLREGLLCEVKLMSSTEISSLISAINQARIILGRTALPESAEFRFMYALKLFTVVKLDAPSVGVPAWMVYRFHYDEMSPLAVKSVQLSQRVKIAHTRPTVILMQLIMSDLVRNKFNCPGLRYLPRMYRSIFYTVDDGGKYSGVSLAGLWDYIQLGKSHETRLPLMEVILGAFEEFGQTKSDVTESEPLYQFEDISLNLASGKYVKKSPVVRGEFVMQAVVENNEEFFDLVLGKTQGIKRIERSTETLERYFVFLRMTIPMEHPNRRALSAQEDNPAKKDWSTALWFLSEMLYHHGCVVLSLISQLQSEDGFFLFEGFEPFIVLRFAMTEMNFDSRQEIPIELYPVSAKRRYDLWHEE